MQKYQRLLMNKTFKAKLKLRLVLDFCSSRNLINRIKSDTTNAWLKTFIITCVRLLWTGANFSISMKITWPGGKTFKNQIKCIFGKQWSLTKLNILWTFLASIKDIAYWTRKLTERLAAVKVTKPSKSPLRNRYKGVAAGMLTSSLLASKTCTQFRWKLAKWWRNRTEEICIERGNGIGHQNNSARVITQVSYICIYAAVLRHCKRNVVLSLHR